ncbi:MAG: tyrosine decarboxylase MfnA [Candidatus Saliniplasma sp.]
MGTFPEKGRTEKEILEEIYQAEESDLKFSSDRIFGSMCTESTEIGKKVHQMFLESNLGNPGLYEGTKNIEDKVHSAVKALIDGEYDEILSVGGATEGNIIALWRARETSGKRKVLLPESAHFSFQKACNLLDMEPIYIPLDDEYRADVSVIEEKIDDETAAVVGIAGTTELGQIDPIHEIAKISKDTFFHVDAAFGGFVIPFLKELGYGQIKYPFDFENIDTYVLDPHKMGMSTIPLGLMFCKEGSPLSIESPYLTGKDQKTIRGTRSSASIPAFWATLNYLGKDGYLKVIERCMDNTYHLIEMMGELGLESVIDPIMNIASFHHENPKDVVKAMEKEGFNISRTVNPLGLRFVVMPHVSKEGIDKMIKTLGEYV